MPRIAAGGIAAAPAVAPKRRDDAQLPRRISLPNRADRISALPGCGVPLPSLVKGAMGRAYARAAGVAWTDDARVKVLAETLPGFDEHDWVASLDTHFPDWGARVALRFAHTRFDRYALESRANVFVGTWLDPRLLRE